MPTVTIWNEFVHERTDKKVKKIYPLGIHERLREALRADDLVISTAWLDKDDEHGFSEEVLASTDVLLWWGHMAHEAVREDVAARVAARVHGGMGFIALHSAHMSQPFTRLMGTPCTLRWRESDDKCVLWNVAPNHPITRGVPLHFVLEGEEMYSEYFNIPQPEELIFISVFEGGHGFRGGCTFTRGTGKIFYFQPGHETYPSYHNENVLKVIANGIRWAAPAPARDFRHNASMQKVI